MKTITSRRPGRAKPAFARSLPWVCALALALLVACGAPSSGGAGAGADQSAAGDAPAADVRSRDAGPSRDVVLAPDAAAGSADAPDATDSAAGDADAAPPLPPYEVPEGCNPLAAEWDCLLPYPSDVFLVPDATLPGGRRLRVAGAARVVRSDGHVVAPHDAFPVDGFSVLPPILALFPQGVDPQDLVFHTDDVTASRGPDSPTVLGVDRAELLLAWDFTTATKAAVAGDLLAVRADLLARLAATPPAVTVTEVRDDVDPEVFRRVEGTLRVPLYIDPAGPGARLVRAADGGVAAAGVAAVPFSVAVPRSLERPAESGPGRLVVYGHSFFGGRDEIERGWLQGGDQNTYGSMGALVKTDGYEPSQKGTVIYLACDDVAEQCRRIEQAGGKVLLPKMAIGQWGFMAHFEDSEGNRVGVHSMK